MKPSNLFRAAVLTTIAAGVFGGGEVRAADIYASDEIRQRFPERSASLPEGQFNCWIPGRSIGHPAQQNAFDESMTNVVGLSPLASRILDHAKKEDLVFCRKRLDFEQAMDGRGGGYNPLSGIITTVDQPEMPDSYVDLSLFHEAFHDIHIKNRIGFYSKGWTLEKNIKEEMFSEAAAQVAEIAIAFEMRQKGKAVYWDELKEYGGGNGIELVKSMDAFEKTYSEKAASPHKEALEHAASAAWKLIMHDQKFQMTYAAPMAMRYLSSFNKGELGAIADGVDDNSAKTMGKIGSEYSLTRHAEELSLEEIFPGNKKFAQMVRGLDARRLKSVLGNDDPKVKALLDREKKDSNPWLTADLKKFEEKVKKTPDTPTYKKPDGGNPHAW